jgi:hypothetical protein
MSALVASLAEAFTFTRVNFVVGILADKDYAGMLKEMARLPSSLIVTQPTTVRSISIEDLKVEAAEIGLQLVKQIRRALAKGKNDSLDALLIARVVVRERNLPPPPLQGMTHDLKALVDRETLLREATRHRNRAHAMLTALRPGYWRAVPALTSTRRLQAARRLVEDDAGVRAELLHSRPGPELGLFVRHVACRALRITARRDR